MTTTVQAPPAADRPEIPHVGVPGLRLVRSELRKITTTNAWWLFGLASLGFTAFALLINTAQASDSIARARDAQQHDLELQAVNAAANIFTSGQFFGLLLVMLLGVLVITNEFQYQTATATFIMTPRRTRVVFGKLFAVLALGFVFWLLARAVSFAVGLLYFHNLGLPNSLGAWPVQRALLLNLAAYLLWALFGFGLGTLVRSQIGSVVLCLVIYLVGLVGAIAVFNFIRGHLIHSDWVLTAAVSAPTIASEVMVSPEKLYPEAAPWWGGALSMAAWSLVAGAIGIVLNRRRDIN